MGEEKRRVSCNGFGVLTLDDGILVVRNRNRSKPAQSVYSLPGGAFRYDIEAEPFLLSLGAELEKPDKRDLRMKLSPDRQAEFEDWYFKRVQRELDPTREIRGELGKEETAVLKGYRIDVEYKDPIAVIVEKETTRAGQGNEMTRYAFEMFSGNIKVAREGLDKLYDAIRNPGPHTNVRIITSDQIRTANISGDDMIMEGGLVKVAADLMRYATGNYVGPQVKDVRHLDDGKFVNF
ncbi:MAG TPA: hypothetical protein VJI68_02970 [Candidatus Nanoarchaeia archaeon]|nr:hypothetical protein [Candidatus Nanoarchaeia archaeon]